jgi:hypothetical protein
MGAFNIAYGRWLSMTLDVIERNSLGEQNILLYPGTNKKQSKKCYPILLILASLKKEMGDLFETFDNDATLCLFQSPLNTIAIG